MEQQQKRSGVPPQVSAFLVVLGLLGIVIGFAALTDPPDDEVQAEDAVEADAAPVDPFAGLEPDPQDPANAPKETQERKSRRGISDLALDEDWKSALGLAGAGRTAGKNAQIALDQGRVEDARQFLEQANDAYNRAAREGRAAQPRFTGDDLKRIQSKLAAWSKERLALPTVD